ncbi:hypothetical protein FRB96_001883 [Tulasnella sp. 330]|nr:hypothetical protein FRB96_001883 [Tulasnella sp. 330]KAG8883608.1 hypothetical protein FRB97_006302 [Tulasnella sp. 331]
MLKVLALHGYAQNGAILCRKMSVVQKLCQGDLFANGPIILPKVTGSGFTSTSTTQTQANQDPEAVARAWWRSNREKTHYSQVSDSAQYLRDLMHKEQFDGVFGFSQGASLVGLLCAMLERPDICSEFLVDGQSPQPPFKFGIAVGGFKPTDLSLAPLFEEYRIKTPTLHVLGKTDLILPRERSQTLIDACENPRVEEHDGGHVIPSTMMWGDFFRTYIRSFDPSSGVSPTDAALTPPKTPSVSGTSTPVTL